MGRVNKEWRGRRRNSPHLLFTVSSHTTSGYHIHHSFDKQDRLIPLFYIKPQLKNRTTTQIVSCFIPLFYIKPQLVHSHGDDAVHVDGSGVLRPHALCPGYVSPGTGAEADKQREHQNKSQRVLPEMSHFLPSLQDVSPSQTGGNVSGMTLKSGSCAPRGHVCQPAFMLFYSIIES